MTENKLSYAACFNKHYEQIIKREKIVLTHCNFILMPHNFSNKLVNSLQVVSKYNISAQISKSTMHEINYLKPLGLKVIKFDPINSVRDLNSLSGEYLNLCNKIILVFMQLLTKAYQRCFKFLHKRIMNEKSMTSYSVIQQDLVTIYAEINFVKQNLIASSAAIAINADKLLHIAIKLAEVSGAKAILAGDVITIVILISLFRQLYFS